MLRHILAAIWTVSTVALLGQASMAQGLARGTIHASENTLIRPMATVFRMQLQVRGQGKTLEEAIDHLRKRRNLVREQLLTLGASEESIKFEGLCVLREVLIAPPPTTLIPPGVSPALQPVPAGQPANADPFYGRTTVPPLVQPPPISATGTGVATMVTAEWPLRGEGNEEILLAGEKVRDKVLADKVCVAESTTPMPMSSPSAYLPASDVPSTAPSLGFVRNYAADQPVFRFAAYITTEQRKTAITEAFAKAKSKAAELAEAAGGRLGSLDTINYVINGSTCSGAVMANESEATGASPTDIVYRLRVDASFHLE